MAASSACPRSGREKLLAWRAQPTPLIVISDRWGGFFGPLRNLVGVETLCTLFYDDPAFVEEMMDANADMIIAMMSQVLDVIDIDAFGFWEDMAYNVAWTSAPWRMAPRPSTRNCGGSPR